MLKSVRATAFINLLALAGTLSLVRTACSQQAGTEAINTGKIDTGTRENFDPVGARIPHPGFGTTTYNSNYTYYGPGLDYGNDAPTPSWWVGSVLSTPQGAKVYKQGIFQTYSGNLLKWSNGDGAFLYGYNHCDGGSTAPSDEGCAAATLQLLQDPWWLGNFQPGATVASGMTQLPVKATNPFHNIVTAGAPILRMSTCADSAHRSCADAAIYTGTIAGQPNTGSLGSNSVGGYLSQFPVSGISGAGLPKLTCWGTTAAALPATGFTAGTEVTASVTITLGTGSGACAGTTASPAFALIAGPDMPEPITITASGAPSGRTQHLTITYSKPHPRGLIITQGGIAGMYVTPDADNAYHPQAYLIAGSLTGKEIYTAVNSGGNSLNVLVPMGSEPVYCALTTPAKCPKVSAGFHIYQGVEIAAVVRDPVGNFVPYTLPNNIPWNAYDQMMNPQYPVFGGHGLGIVWQHNTPTFPGNNGQALDILAYGTGFGNEPLVTIRNNNPDSYYQNLGGALALPRFMDVFGRFSDVLSMGYTPPYDSNCGVVCFAKWGNGLHDGSGNTLLVFSTPGHQVLLNPDTSQWIFRNDGLQVTGNLGSASLNVGDTLKAGVAPHVLASKYSTLDDGYGNMAVHAGLFAATVTATGAVSAPRFHETLTTPASSSAPCKPGDFTDDANFHYVCVAVNTWKRVALTSF